MEKKEKKKAKSATRKASLPSTKHALAFRSFKLCTHCTLEWCAFYRSDAPYLFLDHDPTPFLFLAPRVMEKKEKKKKKKSPQGKLGGISSVRRLRAGASPPSSPPPPLFARQMGVPGAASPLMVMVVVVGGGGGGAHLNARI